MNSKIVLLGTIFVAQLMLVAILTLSGRTASDSQEQWLNVTASSIDGLELSDGSASVSMTKTERGWAVGEVLADETKIAALLDKLAGIETVWPVATSRASAERFEVADDNYQRRLRLLVGDDQMAELFLGTSPGYRRVHARVAGEGDIFSIELSNFEVPVDLDGWIDKSVLAITEELQSITLSMLEENATHSLKHSEEGWLYNGGAADPDAAATYANRFKTLRVLSVEAQPDEDLQIIANLEVEALSGTKTLAIAKQGEEYLIQAEAQTYKVATYIAEQLLLIDVDLAAALEKQ